MQKTVYTNALSELPEVAKKLIEFAENEKIWLFDGEMGAGKTTLIRALCEELKVLGNTQSPTFSIVNEYHTQNHQLIYHFDCYRLKDIYEALDIGIEEYLDSGNLCFIEWAEKIEPLLPEKHLKISILALDENRRELIFQKIQ